MNRLTAEEAVNGLQRVADMRMSRIKELEQQVADLLAALEEKKQELAVAYGSGTTEPEREWFSALDTAKARLEAHHEDADLGDDETCSVCGFHYVAAAHQGEAGRHHDAGPGAEWERGPNMKDVG